MARLARLMDQRLRRACVRGPVPAPIGATIPRQLQDALAAHWPGPHDALVVARCYALAVRRPDAAGEGPRAGPDGLGIPWCRVGCRRFCATPLPFWDLARLPARSRIASRRGRDLCARAVAVADPDGPGAGRTPRCGVRQSARRLPGGADAGQDRTPRSLRD